MISLAGTQCTELLAEFSVTSFHHSVESIMVSDVMTLESESELFEPRHEKTCLCHLLNTALFNTFQLESRMCEVHVIDDHDVSVNIGGQLNLPTSVLQI